MPDHVLEWWHHTDDQRAVQIGAELESQRVSPRTCLPISDTASAVEQLRPDFDVAALVDDGA